jgi:hypothetical protein
MSSQPGEEIAHSTMSCSMRCTKHYMDIIFHHVVV